MPQKLKEATSRTCFNMQYVILYNTDFYVDSYSVIIFHFELNTSVLL